MKQIKSLLADLAILAGALAIPAGVYEIYKPAGFIVSGIMLIALGALLHYSTHKTGN